MRSKFVPLTLIMLLATLLALSAFSIPVTYSSVAPKVQQEAPQITIDGDFSDWEAIIPLLSEDAFYEDAEGDTYPWSKNMTILSIGNTSEADLTAYGAPFDEARDLKALYVTIIEETVYIRLDVMGLPYGDGMNWTYGSLNASQYQIFFDTDLEAGSGGMDGPAAIDTSWQGTGMNWEMYLGISTVAPGGVWLQTFAWETFDDSNSTLHGGYIGNLTAAQNMTLGALEFSIPKEDFKYNNPEWNGTFLRIIVASIKPGEYYGGQWGNWTHAFDPQAPGTAGEDWGYPGEPASGSDFADLIPGGTEALVPQIVGRRNAIAEGNYIDIVLREPGIDTEKPTISSNVVQSPAKGEVDPNDAVNVTVAITDNVAVKKALLRYSTDNTTFTNVTMTLVSGTNNYTGQIPSTVNTAGKYVSYKVYADDAAGNYKESPLLWYRVKAAPTGPEIPWLWIVVGIVVVIIVIAVAYMLMRKKPA